MENSSTGTVEASARVTWAGWGGEVSGNSGALTARTATQVELGGPGGGTNPEELLAAALANCYTSTLTSLARARKIELMSIETRAHTRLAWDEARPHHIARGDLEVRILSPQLKADVLALAEDARRHCPVCNVLQATAEVTLKVAVEAGGAAAHQPG